MKLTTIDLAPRIGTEIKADRAMLIGGEHAQQIRDLLEQRGALVFRGVDLSDTDQVAFAKTLGGVIPQGENGVYKISLDSKLNDTADILRGSFCWHIDGTTDDIPTRASMLTPRRLLEAGGTYTEFANTYAAYEDLPESDKKTIDKLRVSHMQETLHRVLTPDMTEAHLKRLQAFPKKTHPLVWTHKSGRKSLVLGLTATSIEDMDTVESRALIDRLQEWASRPQYIYRHKWKLGDLLIWDNTGVMHRVEPYPIDGQRMLSRTTLIGEEALV
jgi:alpha-ketoglutarate-dependent taurine dioxygenase